MTPTPQDVFEFIRDNLSLEIEEGGGRDYGGPNGLANYRSFHFKLNLINPTTGAAETISEQSFSIDG